MNARMHADEADIDLPLVRRLLTQFPGWAALPVAPVTSSGTDNAMFRLGADLAVRLPRIPAAARQGEKERAWLPRVAPLLPLPVPVPLATGEPDAGFPWRWSVCPWLPGENALAAPFADARQAAADLGAFLLAMRAIDLPGGPPPGDHNFGRGVPLAERDDGVRESVAALARRGIDPAPLLAAWEAALAAPVWAGPPRWLHGDVMAGNLLVRDGRLAAVIDFGGLGVGDPACDLMAAWAVLPASARAAFRDAVDVDDATWDRGRGWALSQAVMALPYYWDTNPGTAGQARHTIAAVLSDS